MKLKRFFSIILTFCMFVPLFNVSVFGLSYNKSQLSSSGKIFYAYMEETLLKMSNGDSSLSVTIPTKVISLEDSQRTVDKSEYDRNSKRFCDKLFDAVYDKYEIDSVLEILNAENIDKYSHWKKGESITYTESKKNSNSDEYVVTLTFKLTVTPKSFFNSGNSSTQSKLKSAYNVANNIVNKYKNSSDYDKLKGYHDEICKLTDYDYNLAEQLGVRDNTQDFLAFTSYNVFDNDSGTLSTSEGYAKAFKYLCDLTEFKSKNIKCYYVTGYRHLDSVMLYGWNIVEMENGRRYIVDVSCDDTAMVSYNYFLKGVSGSVLSGYDINGTLGYRNIETDCFKYLPEDIDVATSNYKSITDKSINNIKDFEKESDDGLYSKADRISYLKDCIRRYDKTKSNLQMFENYLDYLMEYDITLSERVSVLEILKNRGWYSLSSSSNEQNYSQKKNEIIKKLERDIEKDSKNSVRASYFVYVINALKNYALTVSEENSLKELMNKNDWMKYYEEDLSDDEFKELKSRKEEIVLLIKTSSKSISKYNDITKDIQRLVRDGLSEEDNLYLLELLYNYGWQDYIETETDVEFKKTLTNELRIKSSNVFYDVERDSWYENAVSWTLTNEITNGTSATTFSPTKSCTRAEIITFMWRAAGSPVGVNYPDSAYKDVSKVDWFYEAAMWAKYKGLVNSENFSPNSPCTRASAVEYLWILQNKPTYNSSVQIFKDVSKEDSVLFNSTHWAYLKGITTGTDVDTFTPNKTCNRAEIVTLLLRSFNNDVL